MLAYRKIAVLSIAFVCGCGGDDDGADGADGADDMTPLTELSSADAQALCEAFDDRYDDALLDFQTITCYLSAIGATDCEELVEGCLATAPNDPGALTCEITSGADLPACAADITVGDLNDCFDAVFGGLAGLADEITCESDPKDFSAIFEGLPEECAFYDTCEF